MTHSPGAQTAVHRLGSIAKRSWLLMFVACGLIILWNISTIRLWIALSLQKHDSILVSLISDRNDGDIYDGFRLAGSQKDLIFSRLWKDTVGDFRFSGVPSLKIHLLDSNARCVGQIRVYGVDGGNGGELLRIARNGAPVTDVPRSSDGEYVVNRRMRK